MKESIVLINVKPKLTWHLFFKVIKLKEGNNLTKYLKKPFLRAIIINDDINLSSYYQEITSYRKDIIIMAITSKNISYLKTFTNISLNTIRNEINKRLSTPFFDALQKYAAKNYDSWHTPGHSAGDSLKNSKFIKNFYHFFGKNLFKSDLSVSVSELDSLLAPIGILAKSQKLASTAYLSKHTFFCTNGTSSANKIVLQTILRPNDYILMDRNCHKSVHYGVIISGANPIFLNPTINEKNGILGPVLKKDIFHALSTNKCKLLILTSSTYDGLTYDLPEIIDQAHKHKVKVLIDEAWCGHFAFHPHFFPSAMMAGADYATQSTHKTMSALSQGSMIHVNDPDFDINFFMENYNMHTSTSPQYPLIASLDIARKQMSAEGYYLLSRNLKDIIEFKNACKKLKYFKVLTLKELISPKLAHDNVRLDPMKLTILTSITGIHGKEIASILHNHYKTQIEKSTFSTISLLVTIAPARKKLKHILKALIDIEKNIIYFRTNQKIRRAVIKLEPPIQKMSPRDAFYAKTKSLPIDHCENKISASLVVPYPPGIPILVPGQLITKNIISLIHRHLGDKLEVHGIINKQLNIVK